MKTETIQAMKTVIGLALMVATIVAVDYLLPNVNVILRSALGVIAGVVIMVVFGMLTGTEEEEVYYKVKVWSKNGTPREEAVSRVVKGAITEERRNLFYKAIDEFYGKVSSKYY